MLKEYSFKQQLAMGRRCERLLDRYFDRYFRVMEVSPAMQRMGIDRVYSNIHGEYTVEYKSDFLAHKTGNFFAETYVRHPDKPIKLGWVQSCKAQILFYHIVYTGQLFAVDPIEIKRHWRRWSNAYDSARVTNQGFEGEGIKVPLERLEEISRFVLTGIPILDTWKDKYELEQVIQKNQEREGAGAIIQGKKGGIKREDSELQSHVGRTTTKYREGV